MSSISSKESPLSILKLENTSKFLIREYLKVLPVTNLSLTLGTISNRNVAVAVIGMKCFIKAGVLKVNDNILLSPLHAVVLASIGTREAIH